MSSSPPPSAAYLDESLVPNVYAASIVAIVLSGVFFAGRLASKRIQRQPFNASDWALVLGLLCCWGLAIVNMWMTTVGLGRHIEWVHQGDPSLSKLKHLLKVFLADEVFYDLGIASVKISILLLYKGLFGGDRLFNLTSNVLMATVVGWFLGNLLPSIFSCRPISGFWDLDPNAKCIDKTALYISGSSINIATDVAILCLPLTKVLKLHLNWRRKVELMVVFLLGSFVCVVSVYRFTVLFDANSPDTTWSFATVLNWSAIEVATAITSACLPLMRPLFLAVLPRSWSRNNSTVQSGRVAPSSKFTPAPAKATAASTTVGSSKTPRTPPSIAQRHRAMGFGRTTMNSDFELLPDNSFLITTDSDRGAAVDSYGGSAEPGDLENGYRHSVDGIVVTKCIEMSSVDRNARLSPMREQSDSDTSSFYGGGRSTRDFKRHDGL